MKVFLWPLKSAFWEMIKKRVWKRFHETSRGWPLALSVLCTSLPRPRRRRSQATCAQYPKPPDNTDEGNVVALQCFVDTGTGPLGSIMRRPWSDATSITHDCYTCKASEIIAEVLKTVAPQSVPGLLEAVRRKNEVSQFLKSVRPGSDLLLAVVESYKQADTSETRHQLLSQ